MKQNFTLLMLIILPAMMMAQGNNKPDKEGFDPEVHKQKQHKFMTEKAQLTADDSVKFFAIYDEMRIKERELFGDSHEMRNKRPETDAECRAAMIHADSLDLAIKQIQYDYHMRLLDAISPKKAVFAIMAGEEFDRTTFREMMHDWKRANMDDKEGNHDKQHKKGKKGQKGEFNGPRPEGPHPGLGFHGGHPGSPDMEGAPDGPDGPRPDCPAPDISPDSDKTTK